MLAVCAASLPDASVFTAEQVELQVWPELSHGQAGALLRGERCGILATSASEMLNTKNPRLITEGHMVDMKL